MDTTRKPDFARLRTVLLREGEPDCVPFYEHLADPEAMSAVIGRPPGPETTVEFYHSGGYDYVNVILVRPDPSAISVKAEDSSLFGGERAFVSQEQGLIKTRQDLDAYRWPVVDDSILSPLGEIVSLLPDGMKVIVTPVDWGPFEAAIFLMGYAHFSYALYDDIGLVREIFERVAQMTLDVVTRCMTSPWAEKIGAVSLGDDMGFVGGTLVSPDLLREHIFPLHKQIVESVHSYDLPFILHSCGNLTAVMDDLISDVGIDAKHSYEDKILPIAEAKRRYGDRIAVVGGVDMDVLCRATEADLRRYVRSVIRGCAPGGGFALGTGNTVASYVPAANYLAMLDEGLRMGVYPMAPSS
jgi:uroporphyrinogen decarboxylase